MGLMGTANSTTKAWQRACGATHESRSADARSSNCPIQEFGAQTQHMHVKQAQQPTSGIQGKSMSPRGFFGDKTQLMLSKDKLTAQKEIGIACEQN